MVTHITLEQLYEQAKAIRWDIESVNYSQWIVGGDKNAKFYAFTDDETFLSSSPEGLLADILASTKTKAVA